MLYVLELIASHKTERFRLLKENFGQQALELDQATKRTLKLQQSMGRQDQAVHTVSTANALRLNLSDCAIPGF